MQDRPTYSELLEAIQHFIEADVVSALEGPKKFHARVAANVLSIIRRELDSEEAELGTEWEGLDDVLGAEPRPSDRRALKAALRRRTQDLCARIRGGEADSGEWRERVWRHVRQTVVAKLAVANPRYLGKEMEP